MLQPRLAHSLHVASVQLHDKLHETAEVHREGRLPLDGDDESLYGNVSVRRGRGEQLLVPAPYATDKRDWHSGGSSRHTGRSGKVVDTLGEVIRDAQDGLGELIRRPGRIRHQLLGRLGRTLSQIRPCAFGQIGGKVADASGQIFGGFGRAFGQIGSERLGGLRSALRHCWQVHVHDERTELVDVELT